MFLTARWKKGRCVVMLICRCGHGASSVYGTKTEIKNMNSFRAVFRGLSFEEERQKEAIVAGPGDHTGNPALG